MSTAEPTGQAPGRTVPEAAEAGGAPPWFAWVPPGLREAGLLALLTFVQVVGTTGAAHDQPDRTPLDAPAYVLIVAGPALLALRRRWPPAALAGVLAVDTLYFGLGYPYGPVVLSAVLALGGAVVRGYRLAAWLGGLAALAGYFAFSTSVAGHAPSVVSVTGHVAWLLVLLSVAELVRAQRTRVEEGRRIRAERQRRQASEQRLRIAQELHDVLGHNISLINVQASVALHLMDAEPEQARTALQAIKEASKGMLAETRSALEVLRETEAPRAPAPRLDDLSSLVAQCAAAGLQVRVTTRGTPRPVGPAVDLAAYRIVQEALTNVLRHARVGRAEVTLDHGPDALVVTVADRGAGVRTGATAEEVDGAEGQRAGQGIPGMRERAATVGGTLTAGPGADGGFSVVAVLPTGASR